MKDFLGMWAVMWIMLLVFFAAVYLLIGFIAWDLVWPGDRMLIVVRGVVGASLLVSFLTACHEKMG